MRFIWKILRAFGCRRYRRLMVSFVPYEQADIRMRKDPRWRIAKEEDNNKVIGMVWIEQVEEILP